MTLAFTATSVRVCLAGWGNVRQASVCVRPLVFVNTVIKVSLLFVCLLLVFLRQIETVSAYQNQCLCIVNWAVRDCKEKSGQVFVFSKRPCQDKCLCSARPYQDKYLWSARVHTRTSVCVQQETVPGLVFVVS